LHVESRPSQNLGESQFEVILKLDIARENLVSLLKLLKQSTSLSRVTVASATNFVAEIPGNRIKFICLVFFGLKMIKSYINLFVIDKKGYNNIGCNFFTSCIALLIMHC